MTNIKTDIHNKKNVIIKLNKINNKNCKKPKIKELIQNVNNTLIVILKLH